jgi:hydrophobic/amphiphilic exporter-1 (mainly G- bacteria), HAE1 family
MSEFFIRRPIVAMVLSIFMVLIGLITLRGIPISQYPEITPPMIRVSGSYSGANALNVEQTVATPIEQQVNGVENMIYMQSVNANDGSLTLNVSFEVGTDLDNANMLTQNRVNQANPSLPNEVKALGINTRKSLPFPLMLVSLTSPNGTFDAQFLNNYGFINIVDALKRIKGVGDVNVFGGSEYAMRMWLRPDRMSALGITVTDIRQAVNAYNAIVPGGQFGAEPSLPGTQNTYSAQLQARLVSPEEFGGIVVKRSETGAQVLLREVARIELGTEFYSMTSRLDGRPASTIAIFQSPGSNGLEVVAAVRQAMDERAKRFPQDLEYRVSLDTTAAINEGITEIVHTLFEALLLVILVVFLFLQDWRATLIPLLAVPVSLIGTFIFFPMLGFSVNVLSLLGLVLAIGLVVDDAIVVVEAVMHHMEHGLSPKEATRKAMKEVTSPIIATSIILAAVFIPVALTGGITGRLYQQFAITIAVSVLISSFNALTLSPALCGLLLKPKDPAAKKNLLQRFFDGFNRRFERITTGYLGLAGFFARKVGRAVVFVGIIVVVMLMLGRSVPGGFVPEEDEGYFMCSVTLPDAASLQRTTEVSRKLESILAGIPGVKSVTVVDGNSIINSTIAPNSATAFVQLQEWGEREHTSAQLMRMANALLATHISEATAFAFGPPPIPGLGSSAGFSLQLQDLQGNAPQYLEQQARAFIAAVQQRPEIGRALTLYRSTIPQKSIEVDNDRVEKMGLRLDDVNQTIAAFLGGNYVNNFNQFGRQYRTYLQADAEYRMSPSGLHDFFVRAADGRMVPLSAVAAVRDTVGPLYTNRFNLYRSAEIMGGPAPGYTSAQALDALEQVAQSTLPNDIGYTWSNMSYQEKVAGGQGGTVFAMALLFVFLILAAQYESWKLPFSVLLGTPWAVMGALFGLWAMRFFSESYVNNVFAQIGLVMLIGLNAKNAILIVEFAKLKVDEGEEVLTAALEAARLRFRPILMTSFAFILGVIPLITATGAGAEARKVMGMAVFAGMLVSTIIGCIVIPSLFVLIVRKKRKDAAQGSDTMNPVEA